jgi:DNA-binding GntR family transcriptional regulator
MNEALQLRPPVRRTAADEVYQALKRDIITLRQQPGAALTEHQLATTYGTSRVPVREACRRLQQEGLVTAVAYKGYFVSQVSLKEIGDCFELRSVLESFAVECAVERSSEEGVRELVELAQGEYTYHDWESYALFLDRNLEFHLHLATLSENDRLITTLHDLLGSMQRYFFLGLDLGDFASEMRDEHEELVSLIKQREKGAAGQCVRDQITASRERIMRAMVAGHPNIPLK